MKSSKAVFLKVFWRGVVDPGLFKNVPEGEIVLPMSAGQGVDILQYYDLFIGDSLEEILQSIEERLAEFELAVCFDPPSDSPEKFKEGEKFVFYILNGTIYTGKSECNRD